MKRDKNKERDRLDEEMREDQFNSVDALLEHLLSCGDDLILLTLKGHLVIEHLLDTTLARLLRIPRLPEDGDAKLEFYQKLKLVEAVACHSEPGPNADLFCVVAKLNTVRNKLAHNLKKPDEIDADVRSLLECYFAKAGKKKPVNIKVSSDNLRNCLIKLWSFLFNVRLHFHRLETKNLVE
jgi:hypothetical protein